MTSQEIRKTKPSALSRTPTSEATIQLTHSHEEGDFPAR